MQGQLVLVNTNDSTEHCFQLQGVAEKPLAVEFIKLHTQAKRR